MGKNYDYDTIIIGAGISGLVCGCYLAKAGLKTLIVEKNSNVGGYCTSFKRNGFFFDACVYSLSSLREGGSINRIFRDFDLEDDVKIINNDIPDIILTPKHKLYLNRNVNKTILEFQRAFPQEKTEIRTFFEYIVSSPVINLTKVKNITFEKMLDAYFKNKELITALSIILLGYTGLPPSKLSALVACLVYKEFVFDGGYYPESGMQSFSNALANKFQNLGGTLLSSTKVERITIKDGKVSGIKTNSNDLYCTKCVVGACDYREIFFELIGKDNVPQKQIEILDKMEPSLSAFLVYLCLNKNFKNNSDLKSHVWIIENNYDEIEKIYDNLNNDIYDYVALSSATQKSSNNTTNNKKDSLFLYTNMPFKTSTSWSDEKKNEISGGLIKMAGRLIENIGESIDSKIVATPNTLYKWTSNYKGACYGLADTVSQFSSPDFSENTFLDNLFLVGHWSNKSSGITSVANNAYWTSSRIIKNINKI